MENAEFSRLKNEWLYGVELFLDSDNGRDVVETLTGDVEKMVFLMLLESMIPADKIVRKSGILDLHRWKSIQYHDAWIFYQEHKRRVNVELSNRELERGFLNLKQKAYSQIDYVMQLTAVQDHDEDLGQRDTPVVDALQHDANYQRETIPCINDPEIMKRMERYIQMSIIGGASSGLVLDDTPVKTEHISILPPPPLMRSTEEVEGDSSKGNVARSNNEHSNTDDAPEITISFDESGLDEN